MQIQKVIEQLGFSSKEARVYLAALELGETHISDLALKVKMPRSSVQAIIEKLYKNGFVNFYVMRRYKYWIAENPEKFLAELKRREATLSEALPELQALHKASWGKRRTTQDKNASLTIFRMIAEGSEQPVLIANEKAEIEHVNAAWEKQFGYKLKEILGANPRMFQSGATPKLVYERMWKALGSKKMFQSDAIIDKRKDGTFFNLLTTILPIVHKGKAYYIQILDDITERKRVEALQKKFKQAR